MREVDRAAHQEVMEMTQDAAHGSDATVPIALYSAALDEVWVLRAACAYEAGANRATCDMRLPASAARYLGEVNEALLAPAARGESHTLRLHADTSLDIAAWEESRNLGPVRRRGEEDPTWVAEERLYVEAVAEIGRLRAVLVDATEPMRLAREFRTFPTSRRRIIDHQIERMLAVTSRGDLGYYYGARGQVLKACLRAVGGAEMLTGPTYADEVAARRR